MAEIDRMISRGQFDLAAAQERADTISVLLMAFPHLFPPESNRSGSNEGQDPVALPHEVQALPVAGDQVKARLDVLDKLRVGRSGTLEHHHRRDVHVGGRVVLEVKERRI